MMKQMTVKLTGVAPLLMHNGQLADPMNAFSKQLKPLTSARKKSDEMFAEISRLEFLGGLYVNESGWPTLPASVLEATFVEGAKKSKNGKTFKACMYVFEDAIVKKEDWRTKVNDENSYLRTTVVVGTQRIMRTRPMIKDWSCVVTVHFTEDINESEMLQAIEHAGQYVGLLDWRPKYGRFTVEQI